MDEEERLTFEAELQRQQKESWVYVLLAICFPIQLALLGKWGLQIAFWLTGGGFFVWWVIEWFLTPKRVREYNDALATDIARTIKIVSS
jgi:hypothetical protein